MVTFGSKTIKVDFFGKWLYEVILTKSFCVCYFLIIKGNLESSLRKMCQEYVEVGYKFN